VIRKTALWLNRLLWTGLVISLLLVASYVSLGRYYVDHIDSYQQALINQFVDMTGMPLEVNTVKADWSELSPVLTLDLVNLFSPNQHPESILTIRRANIEVNPIASLLYRAPQVRWLELQGLEFSLEEFEKGRWQLKGYEVESSSDLSAIDRVIDLLLVADRLSVEDAVVQLHFLKGNSTRISVKELSLNRGGDFRRVRLTLGLEQTDKQIEVLLESKGDPRDTETFEMSSYAKIDDIDFKQQLPLLHSLGVGISEAQLDTELWLNIFSGGRWQLEGHVATPEVDLSTMAGEDIDSVENLRFNFIAEKNQSNDWQLWFPGFSASWRGETFQFQHLQLAKTAQNYQLALQHIQLEKLVEKLANINVLGEKGDSILESLSPAGELSNVYLTLSRADKLSFILQAEMQRVSVQPWHGAPGLQGVSGYVEVNNKNGLVLLDTDHFVMDFPQVYEKPMSFTHAQAAVGWTIDDDAVSVASGPIYLHADHGPASGLLRLRLPLKPDPFPSMTLLVGLKNTEATRRDKFIPKILNPNLLSWLAQSIPSGFIPSAGFIYRGSLKKNGDDDRTVQLFVDTDNTRLDYHPDWPVLEKVKGLVVVDDNEVWVSADEGMISDLQIQSADVYLETLTGKTDWLTVKAQSSGSAAGGLEILKSSGLKKAVGNTFDNWEMGGDLTADASLRIPLDNAKAKPKIDVRTKLQKARLGLPDYRLAFNQLSGGIHYSDDKGLQSKKLKGLFFDKPMNASISQQSQKIIVDLGARVDMKNVQQWTGQPVVNFFQGETDLKAKLIVGSDKDSELNIQSNLNGVTIDLPEPFSKKAVDSWNYHLNMPLVGEKPILSMSIDDRVSLQLAFSGQEFAGGKITLDEQATSDVPIESGEIVLTGALNQFDLKTWQPVYDRYSKYADKQKVSSKPGPSLVVKQLSIDHLTAFDMSFDNGLLGARYVDNTWQVHWDNAVMDVELSIPDNADQSLGLTFARLKIPEVQSHGESLLAGVNPADLVDVNVAIQQLFLGDELWGDLSFSMNTEPAGVLLERIEGTLRGVQLGTVDSPLILAWLKDGDRHQSFFNGGLLFKDFGDVLERWGYQRFIESKNGLFDLSLVWAGRPDQWSLTTSEGEIVTDIDEGRFLSESGGTVGALKVVGILNFTNLMRRLRLDFSDITKKGVKFDAIDGRVRLEQSVLAIEDSLVIKSPSSGFQLRGIADLQQESLDMELVATLPVASNLPWIAALAGGLPTAAGVYVASKLFGKSVDKLSSAVYSVKGDWNEPEMKFERLFSDKGKLSKKSTSKQPKESSQNNKGSSQHLEQDIEQESAPAQQVGEEVSLPASEGGKSE